MKQLLLIAIGGASGALCRHWLVSAVNAVSKGEQGSTIFPYGTIAVNIIGSFIIGIMYVVITERLVLHPDWRSIAMVGFLGAFTTFSTFSLETITLLENGHLLHAVAYVSSSVLICIIAAWLAMTLARMI